MTPLSSGRTSLYLVQLMAFVFAGLQQAHELGALLSQHHATLNLIPWNPVIAAASNEDAAKRGAGQPLAFAAPRIDDVVAFQAVVRDQVGCLLL
jgi:hypothetical protein